MPTLHGPHSRKDNQEVTTSEANIMNENGELLGQDDIEELSTVATENLSEMERIAAEIHAEIGSEK